MGECILSGVKVYTVEGQARGLGCAQVKSFVYTQTVTHTQLEWCIHKELDCPFLELWPSILKLVEWDEWI